MSVRGSRSSVIVAMIVVVILMSGFAVIGAHALSDNSLAAPSGFENPVSVVKVPGAPKESVVTRTWTCPGNGMLHQWINNSGLKELSISIYDKTPGAHTTVYSSLVAFSQFGAYPSGTVALKDLAVLANHVYVFTLSPTGRTGTSALYFHEFDAMIPPVASFRMTMTAYTLYADASASYDPDGRIVGYAWSWGDGTVGIGVAASHTYAAIGVYLVTLTVTDNSHLTASTTMYFISPPYVICGYTIDSSQAPLTDCAVRITDLRTRLSAVTVSDSVYGAYQFNLNDLTGGWKIGDLIVVTATKGTMSGSNVAVTQNAAFLVLNVTLMPPPLRPPYAGFDTTLISSSTISVNASRSFDQDGYIVEYSWNWGDGSTGTGVMASHTYAAFGWYHITLTVTDNDGLKTTSSTDYRPLPFMLVGWTVGPDGTTLPDCIVTMTDVTKGLTAGTVSDPIDGYYSVDLNDVLWGWAVGDLINVTATNGTMWGWNEGVITNVPYLVLQVTLSKLVLYPPVASFALAINGLTVSVDASGSHDTDGYIVSYDWNWGDASADGSGVIASHTYAASGLYSITLTVTDNDGLTNQITHSQVPPPPPPFAAFNCTVDQLTLHVDGSGSYDMWGSLVSYAWSWGDGSAGSTGPMADHQYATAGTYTVTLTVTSCIGLTNSISKNITLPSA